MNGERFKQKIAALEKEREDFIARLTPEEQQAFKQKLKEFDQREDIGKLSSTLTWGKNNTSKNK
ncbi:hypothetical protein AAE02nite_27720 [Adhaeribacter aerolatus]|uniref:Uncharacterized protein n=1 Tax=Adhaeribacter aerolatus TaxID=670289 RepID=A0A512AZG5_9BACT|nr:hypothetical protein [Adhaeribacter aerolatus]GEO05108.1 hypothetical protein AAE02nite_27720 [Adhaeribacter aerolatus]